MSSRLADRFEELARRIAAALALKPGEHVLLSGGVHQFDLLAKIAVHAAAAGAHPRVAVSSDEMSRRMVTDVPAGYLDRDVDPHDKYMAGLYDAALAIDGRLDETLFADVPPERLRLGQKAGKILADVARSARRRSIYMGWPAPAKAAACGMSLEAFEALFLEALFVDEGAMASLAAGVEAVLAAGGETRITSANGSDLRFRLDPARRVMVDAGRFDAAMVERGDITKNLPCGEVYTTPVETTVEGVAVFELVFHDGRPIRDLRLVFEGGRMVRATAAEGLEHFEKRYGLATNDRDRLGELGIGINPAMKRPIGHTLLDEKIHGSVHLALGENRMYGGVNASSLHWDLVMLKPTLVVGGKTVLEGGRFAGEKAGS